MSSLMRLVVIALVLLAAGGLAFFRLHGNGHSHDAGGGLQLNMGQKWKTDEPRRVGMERIREIVRAAKPTGSESDIQALAKGIQEQIDYLIANCKLPPAADETLHVMISDFLQGADLVTKKKDQQLGITVMRKALETYPRYFEHDGWLGLSDT